jgi:uncharacterized protein YyaL (SSP411 family)
MVLGERKYTQAAVRAANFIVSTLYENGRLKRYYRDGRAVEKAFLDDYAFVILGLLDLYELTFDVSWLIEARRLGEEMIDLFDDHQGGGFFLTGRDSEGLIARSKPGADGAVPSGNSIAALAILKLGRLTMSHDFAEQGSRLLEGFSPQLEQSPSHSPAMLVALDFWLGPRQEIIIAGDAHAPDTQRMLKAVHSKFLPNAIVMLHDPAHPGQSAAEGADSAFYEIIPFVEYQTPSDGKATAYVCEDYACRRPVTNVDELEHLLAPNTRPQKGQSEM